MSSLLNYSEAWQRKVNGIINTYSNIHHPTKANHSQLLPTATCTQRSSPQTSRTNLLSTPSLSVVSLQSRSVSVTSWHFPLAYSQSTINGRTGSNACTFIALVLSKVATANLPHHIQLASLVNQTTSVFIIDQKTVAFIPMSQHVLLLDSHCHAQSGAHIAMAPSSRIWELMEWYKAFNCFPYSMGTVTNVSFK